MFSERYLNQFNNMADHLSAYSYWLADDVFNEDSFNIISEEYEKKINHFKPASIGKGDLKSNNSLIRNDKNYWLDNNNKALNPVWVLLNNISANIKSNLFLPIKRYEAQFSLYPPGHFYKRHVDKHKQMPARLITLVFYISDWQSANEGELIIYGTKNITIPPKKNSLVLFLSELEHEVLPTKTSRKSLTTWFRDDIL